MSNPNYIEVNICTGKTENFVCRIDFSFPHDESFLELETKFFEGVPVLITDNNIYLHGFSFKYGHERSGGNVYWTVYHLSFSHALGLINLLKQKNKYWTVSAGLTGIAQAFDNPLLKITAQMIGMDDDIEPEYTNPNQLDIFKSNES